MRSPDHGGVAGADIHGRLRRDRQKVGVAPHGQRSPLDPLPGQGAPQGFVVVEHLQGAETELADVHRVQGIDPAALPAS